MPGRVVTPVEPVSFTFDNALLIARHGESVAHALVGAGHLGIARSPKFHRPRGPACMRGACEGCLARVDGIPNVMTCLVPVREGMRVTSQNTLGPRNLDLLRVTDWFFPHGFNHHELFAGVPGVELMMQSFARRVAGMGRLPSDAVAPRAAVRRACDVLVVGSGAAGMGVAVGLSERGRAVEVIDDALEPGGGTRALFDNVWTARRAAFLELADRGSIRMRCSTVAAGWFGGDLLVVSPAGAEIIRPRELVLAVGAHDGTALFAGNDRPGIMSARAGGLLLAGGILVGKRVVVVVGEGGGPFGDAFIREVRRQSMTCDIRRIERVPTAAEGVSAVASVEVPGGGGVLQSWEADALLLDLPRAPAYELCLQAGARVVQDARGFTVVTDHGRIGDGLWALGEVTGVPLTIADIDADVTRAVEAIA